MKKTGGRKSRDTLPLTSGVFLFVEYSSVRSFPIVGYSFWRSDPIGWLFCLAECSYWLVFPFDGVFLLVGYLVFLAECSYWLFILLACHVSQLTGYNILCTNLLLSVSVT